jgi:hypothetical protein
VPVLAGPGNLFSGHDWWRCRGRRGFGYLPHRAVCGRERPGGVRRTEPRL